MTEYPKKLIEVALPLDDINREAAREKSIRHGHPSTLHLWWARRPLAAARAVLFAQLVNDPGGKRGYGAYKGQTKEEALKERERLFDIIRELVKWENTNNEELLERARAEIRKSWEETCKITGEDPSKLPAFHDPFAGGGAIPLEAQRLGLEAYASDLNPVAVLINKAMIEIPPKFAGRPPVNPEAREDKGLFKRTWRGAQGLADDVRYYGKWMRDEAEKRIGHLYPKVEVTAEMAKERPDLKGYVGKKLTVIAWIWARTVKSPNPAYSHVDVPLASTFMLSNKVGKEVYIEPVIKNGGYSFTVKVGKPKNVESAKNGTKLSRGANFQCLMSGVPIGQEHIRGEFKAKRSSERLMAIVAEGDRGRIYLAPTPEHESIAKQARPGWKPEVEMNQDSKDLLSGRGYGFKYWYELFTPRQLVALTTFSDLIQKTREQVKQDALTAGMADDGKGINNSGTGATAYADAVAVYLTFAVDKMSDRNSSICGWDSSRDSIRGVFGRQAIPMMWDFAESHPLAGSAGSFENAIDQGVRVLRELPAIMSGLSQQSDASNQTISSSKLISTDPPYYDNIGYADLSDFFYVWLRRTLKMIYSDLFTTLAVPKAEELVATPYRHESKEKAEAFFLDGMTHAMQNLANQAHSAFPVTIYYAFKQSESSDTGTISTGWETFLEAVLRAGFAVNGTWPMRTELSNRMIGSGTNALASSIILVCRKRPVDTTTISRKDFLRELKNALPEALQDMIGGTEAASPIAPVDLAQAAIGPGMAVFSKYKAVLEADGTPMSVHNALILINKAIDEYFTEAEGEMDADTRFCVDWFQQYGFKESVFGEADVLARAKGTSVEGVQDSGVISAKAGKVRLLKVSEFTDNWNPQVDKRVPIWEACHQMCRALQISETRAGELLARMPEKAEAIRQLAYRLYTLCERKKWADHAALYNGLITSWHAILEESHKVGHAQTQQELFLG